MDKSMSLNKMAKEIHANAVQHGWWNGPRDDDEKLAMIHSEWSEALEEYRKENPMLYYSCKVRGTCFEDQTTLGTCSFVRFDDDGYCSNQGKKPEGIAVELIDGCIRILDMLRAVGFVIPGPIGTAEQLIDVARKTIRKPHTAPIGMRKLPQIVSLLHWYTAEYGSQDNKENACLCLIEAVSVAFLWIKEHEMDPVDLMIAKHEYNITRPYRHGGRVC